VCVGIIGCVCITKANNLKAKEIKDSTINQGENITTINIGADEYLVIKIARETTQEELKAFISRITDLKTEIDQANQRLDKVPEFICSESEPENPKDGAIWLKPVGRKEN